MRSHMDVTAERAEIDAKVSGKTVCTIFAEAVRKWSDRPALRWKRDGEWHQLSLKQYRDDVADLMKRGRALVAADGAAFDASWRAVGPEDTVSLIYTSGTTGPPKGVEYSHNNIVWTLESCRRLFDQENDIIVSYLPLAHVAE